MPDKIQTFVSMMHKKNLFLFLINIALTSAFCDDIFAQDYPANSIAINTGINNFHLLDQHATPVIFRGSGFAPSIEYYHYGRNGLHSIEGTFSHFKLSAAATDNYKTEILSGHFRYSFFLLPVEKRSLKNKPVFAFGASLTSTFLHSDYWILPATSWIKGIESWYVSHSLDLAAQFSYAFRKKDNVTIRLFIPLVSNVSRPEYSSSGDYNYERNDWDVKVFGKTMFITENLFTDLDVSYQRILRENLDLTAGWGFKYARCNKPDAVRWYMNIFKIGLIYRFKKNLKEESE